MESGTVSLTHGLPAAAAACDVSIYQRRRRSTSGGGERISTSVSGRSEVEADDGLRVNSGALACEPLHRVPERSHALGGDPGSVANPPRVPSTLWPTPIEPPGKSMGSAASWLPKPPGNQHPGEQGRGRDSQAELHRLILPPPSETVDFKG